MKNQRVGHARALVASLFVLNTTACRGDELPSAADVLAALQAHRDAITCEWSVTIWDNYFKGTRTATSIVTIHRIGRERIRYRQDDYVYKRGSTEALLWVFDGEVAWRVEFAHRARVRRKEYSTAEVMVWGKDQPNAQAPFGMRDPNFLAHSTFLRRLEEQLQAGLPVTVSQSSESESLIELRVPGTDRDFVGTINPRQPVLLLKTQQFDERGIMKRLVKSEYEEYAPGKWRVQRGTAVWLPDNPADPNPMEWRFECRQNLLNEQAEFSDDVFEVKLLPRMHVYDIRYQVGYDIGVDEIDEELDALASAALERKANAPLNIRNRPAGSQPIDAPEKAPATSRKLFLWLNALALLLIFSWWGFVTLRRRRA